MRITLLQQDMAGSTDNLAVSIQKEFNAKAQRRQDAKEKQTRATESSRSPNSETKSLSKEVQTPCAFASLR